MPSLTATQSAQACANRGSPKRRSESPANKASRSSQAGGFGLLLLLLAAMPYDEQGRDGALETETGGFYYSERPTLASTANLRFCASLDDVMRAGRRALEFACDDDLNDEEEDDVHANVEESDEERRRRRKRKLLQKQAAQSGVTPVHADSRMSYTSSSDEDHDNSSQGNTDDDIMIGHSFASVPTTSTSTTTPDEITLSTLTDLGEECLSFAMGFLPLKDLTVCRGVNKAFQSAAARDVPTPFAGSVFMRFGETHRGGSYATPPNRNHLKWTCSFCSSQNSVNFNQCRQCQGGNGDCTGVRKVFLGQLRKERTTELADWILSRLYPEMKPLHIESHTGKDNRGKGCAWIYVTSAADEAKVLSLNKRMFIDVDDNGQEGAWLCDGTHVEELNNMATARAYKPKRPQVLPRQPLTAERPGSKPQVSRGSTNPANFAAPRSAWQKQQVDTQSTAQELWEQYTPAPTNTKSTPASAKAAAGSSSSSSKRKTAGGFSTHNSAPLNPAPRSRQSPALQSQSQQWNGQQRSYNTYQYQPNTINVYDYSPSLAVPMDHTRAKSPSSSSSGSNSWTHNPYGVSVLSEESRSFDDYAQYEAFGYQYQSQYADYTQGPASME